MRLKKSSFLMKIIILVFAALSTTGLLSIQSKIMYAEEQKSALEAQVASKEESNLALREKIELYGKAEKITEIARSKLGLVLPGEIIFYDISD